MKWVIIVWIKFEYFYLIIGVCNVELFFWVEFFGLGLGKMSEMRNSVVFWVLIFIKKLFEVKKKIMKKKWKVYFNRIFMRVRDMVKLLGNVLILIIFCIIYCYCWKIV